MEERGEMKEEENVVQANMGRAQPQICRLLISIGYDRGTHFYYYPSTTPSFTYVDFKVLSFFHRINYQLS